VDLQREAQGLIDWSWEPDTTYECIIGIISLRLLSYGFTDPMQFTLAAENTTVLDFLDAFNTHTGALDMLVSSWSGILAGGWPRVVALDFNPDLPLDQAKAVRYVADAEWDGSVYTVASLLAYALMARAHNYSFAYALEMGSHAFFVRSDLLADEDVMRPLRAVKKNSHLPDAQSRAFVDVLYDFLPSHAPISNDANLGTDPKQSFSESNALRVEIARIKMQLGDEQPLSALEPSEYPRGKGPVSDATLFYESVLAEERFNRR